MSVSAGPPGAGFDREAGAGGEERTTTTARLKPPGFRERLRLVVAALVLLGTAAGASAYVFLIVSPDDRSVSHPDHFQMSTWDPEVWPPGGTLLFTLVEDPQWYQTGVFDSIEDVRRSVDRALAQWSAIDSADIHWRVGRIAASRDDLSLNESTIEIDGNLDAGGRAGVSLTSLPNQTPLLTGCRIRVRQANLEVFFHRLIVHEAGHCLGLHHSGSPPQDTYAYYEYSRDRQPSPVWGWASQLAVSGDRALDGNLALDDAVGASLLRPGPGWLETTGSIGGTVLVEREPARFVYVLATRRNPNGRVGSVEASGGFAGGGVGAFTDANGGFAIQGLAPGEYLLWIYDDGSVGPFNRFADGMALHITDVVWTSPVTVRAAEHAGPLVIAVRRPAVVPE